MSHSILKPIKQNTIKSCFQCLSSTWQRYISDNSILFLLNVSWTHVQVWVGILREVQDNWASGFYIEDKSNGSCERVPTIFNPKCTLTLVDVSWVQGGHHWNRRIRFIFQVPCHLTSWPHHQRNKCRLFLYGYILRLPRFSQHREMVCSNDDQPQSV